MKIFTTLCCATLALCGAIYAQTPNDHLTVHFNTPVTVGETKLPAGDCDIQVTRGTSDTTILVLRSQAGPSVLATANHLSDDSTDSANTSVVLNRRGNDFHLYRILFAGGAAYQLNGVE
jgi:hypothetical protein